MRELDIDVLALEGDVTRLEDIQRVVTKTVDECGRVDILVNNTGDAWLTHTLNTTDEEWRYCMDVNLHSAIRFTREVAPVMRKQGAGRINLSTIAAHTPFGSVVMDYLTAKAGMLAFSKAVSIELAPDNILVNCVCPGFIRSELGGRLTDSAIPLFGETREQVIHNISNQFVALKTIWPRRRSLGARRISRVGTSVVYIIGSIFDVDGGTQKSI
jgi:NAD(P)-dependent dehydrogenase (short-subunit alcohol dehydrogenase family)